jgi:hypothetical protein
MSDRPEFTLLGTNDAMVWAEEFCRIFDGKMITAATHPNDDVDAGAMVGWFANAMQTAINFYERQALTAKEEQQEAFIEGFQEGRPD